MKRRVSAYLIIVVLLVSLTVILSFKWLRDDGEQAGIQPNRSAWNNETTTSSDFENITQAETCVSQWQQDVLTLEQTLRCVDENVGKAST